MIGHRSGAMSELIERIDPHLPHAFGFDASQGAQTAVHTASATALMEAALVGLGPGPGQRVVSVVNGAFSKRWAEIASMLGFEVDVLEVSWGDAVDPELLAATVGERACAAVTLVANETSTGVRTPLGPIHAALSAHPDTLLLVDVVTLLAGAAVDFDAHGLDFALAGSQKALALPPGLALFCASARYMERARAAARTSWYLDPVRLAEGHAARKTPTTPAIGLYRALARQLEDITAGATLPTSDDGLTGPAAWQARFAKHERMRAATLAWGARHGAHPFPAREELCSPTVSCLAAGSIDVAFLAAHLAERGYQISNGYGPLKGQTFRIGHMGDHTEHGLAELLAACDEVLTTRV